MNAMPPPAAMPVATPTPASSQQPQASPAADAPAKATPKALPKGPSKDAPKNTSPKGTPKTAAPKTDAANGTTNAPKNDADAGNDAASEFALALAQTVNAAPQSQAAEPAKTITSDDAPTDAELAAQAGWFSMPVPQPLPQTPQTTLAMRAGQADDGVDLLEVVTQKAGKDVMALLNEMSGASDQTSDAAQPQKTVETPTMPTLPIAQAETRAQANAVADVQAKPMHSPVGTQAWADELGNRVTLLATQGHQSASLKLNPEHLGPLEVRISIRDDQASVWFGAAHADTRAAIEHALPKLREQFASQGLSLADAGVFREPPRDNSRRAPSGNGVGALQDAPAESTLAVVVRRFGLVDAYV